MDISQLEFTTTVNYTKMNEHLLKWQQLNLFSIFLKHFYLTFEEGGFEIAISKPATVNDLYDKFN